MEITLIAALTRDRVIGSQNGGIPWDLPRDKEHFRSYTAGKAMLIGRRTFEEMCGWFTDQLPIVLTSHSGYGAHSGAQVAPSVSDAISIAAKSGYGELVVAGGGKTFTLALPLATRLVLTWVEHPHQPDGATRFPEIDREKWTTESEQNWPADRENPSPMTLEVLNRRR